MGEFNFGVGRGLVANSEAVEAVLPAGVTLTSVELAEGPRHWFSTANRGQPFDRQVADETWAALRSAGLLDRAGNLPLVGDEDES